MKSIKKIGIVEKILNRFGYYKLVEKKTRKPRAPRIAKAGEPQPEDVDTIGSSFTPLT